MIRRRMMMADTGTTVEGIPPLNLLNSAGNPLKDYRIYGENGGVGDVTKNIFDVNQYMSYNTDMFGNDFSNYFLKSGNGISIRARSYSENYNKFTYSFGSNKVYSLSFNAHWISSTSNNAYLTCFMNYSDGTQSQKRINKYNGDIKYTVTSTIGKTLISIVFGGWGYSGEIEFTNIQLEEGSTATSYEPYGYKIPVQCFDDRYWGKVDLGTLDWYKTSYFGIVIPDLKNAGMWAYANIITNRYKVSPWGDFANRDKVASVYTTGHTFGIRDSSYDSISSFKAAMSGVYLYYEKETAPSPLVQPTITNIYLDEPLALGDYVDFAHQKRVNADMTESSVTLPPVLTQKGNNILAVGTTVQPSNMVVKYIK